MQDVFLRVVRNTGSLRSTERPHAWLFQIARNALCDSLRARLRREGRTDALEFDLPMESDADAERAAEIQHACCLTMMTGRLDRPVARRSADLAAGDVGGGRGALPGYLVMQDTDTVIRGSAILHWTMYNTTGTSLEAGTTTPPAGHKHRYHLHVFALDTTLPAEAGVSLDSDRRGEGSRAPQARSSVSARSIRARRRDRRGAIRLPPTPGR